MENGRAVCDEFQARRRAGGPPITGTVLRGISLDAYVRHAVGAAARLVVPAAVVKDLAAHVHAVPIDNGEWVAIPSGGLELSTYFHAEHPKAQRRQHGARVTDDELRKVRDVYRAAHAARKPPTAEVARELNVSRSTAGRYVQRAREKGFLGPTRPCVAGEQEL